jgi:O-antigen chain-terminating methyltransferase
MDNSVIEIRDEKINVEEIMQKIQDNIRKRQAAGKFPSDPDIIMGSSLTTCCVNEAADAILRDIANVNTTWDMHNYNYSISSHHPFYGIFLVKGRQMVNEEVRRYIDPVISRQTNFNASIVRLLNNTKSKCTELDFKSSHLDEELSRIFSQQEEQLSRKFSEQELQLSRMISNQEEQFSHMISNQELQLSRMISNLEEQFSQNFLTGTTIIPNDFESGRTIFPKIF